jgi:type VI secretion system protein ImpL
MSKIAGFFKNRIVISLIGLIVLSLLIWFVGPYIKFGSDNYAPLGGEVARLIAIMVIVMLWGLNNLRITLMDKKNNAELVADLQENHSGANRLINEQQSEEIHILNERFSQALATLRKLKFAGRGSRKALYELPWYIIIGPPGSGKTTALINSSLEFPLADKFGKEALHGVGGTRNCDWWFTNEAVLIDTAGRYTTQDSHKIIDSGAWDGFLSLLKRNRRRRPINGVIVAISLQELLLQTEDERAAHARTIRTRIDELMNKLEIRFPIYLMFTKSDLVSGFSEFFEDLGKEEREQVWGVSLPNAPEASQSPDLDYLHDAYQGLVKRLYERVITRIHQERDPNRRAAIQAFPQQMENLKNIALQFVQQTFVKNRYQLQPYLRGVYFTSGTQDGTPIDRLMSSVAVNFGFDRQAMSRSMGMGKSFFLGGLFREVIFPESELVGSNRRYESFIRWSQRVGYVGMALLAIILLTVWAGSFTRHEMYMNEVEAYVAEFNAEHKRVNTWSNDLRQLLPGLNALARASIVYDQEAHPWLSGLGMYDGTVDRMADRAYESQLVTMFMPRLLDYMADTIKHAGNKRDLYDDFRTYMMFAHVEHMDESHVMDWFKTRLEEDWNGQATQRSELMAHLAALLRIELEPAQLDQVLVNNVRSRLLQVPVSQRVYSRIRSNPKYSQRVDLFNEFGESVRSTYVVNDAVQQHLAMPLLFTKQAYENINLSPDSEIIANLTREKWVLSDGKDARVDFAEDDLDAVTRQVQEHYYADYRAHWTRMYGALEVKPFEDLRQANDTLQAFIDPVYSPLLSILQVGAANTVLTNPLVSDLADDNKDGTKGRVLAVAATQVNMTAVDKQFREVNQLLRERKDRPPEVQNVIQKVRQLQEFVNEILVAPDPGKKAFEVARARYQSGSGNAITSLAGYANGLPEPLNRWLQTLSAETWKVVLGTAHGHVNAEWKNQVYEPYVRGLANRYPLQRDAGADAGLRDFTEFFKPAGTIDKFTAEYIRPFVDTRSGWNNRGVDNYSLGLSSATLAQIRRAQVIKEVFFSESPEFPGLTFQLRPYDMKKSDARFTLEVGDNRISYSHGPKFWSTLQWAGNDTRNRVRVIFEDLRDQQHSLTYEGPWAWFRLQDAAQISNTSVPNVFLATYTANDGHHSYNGAAGRNSQHNVRYEIKARSVNNPFNKDLLGSFRCPERI